MKIYNQDSIKTISFGKAVRTKIGMYLSADLDQALVLGLRELIYNATDEYEQGFGSEIRITVVDGLISIKDNARGIPVGIREDGINSLVAAFTLPHSGAKHDTEVYAGAVGINGIGAKVVCHTAETMTVVVNRKGKQYSLKFTESEDGAVAGQLDEKATKEKDGTLITYRPSKSVYGDRHINIEEVKETLQELSYFTKGMKFYLNDGQSEIIYESKNGLADALARNESVNKNILYYNKELNETKVELALQWCKHNAHLKPYANNLYVPDGGAFITGFKTSLTKAFNNINGTSFEGDLIRKYLDGYVSVKVKVPQFSNQAKTSLANPEARTAVTSAITEALREFANNHPVDMEKIVELVSLEQRAETAAQRAREIEREIVQGQKKAKMITNLPAKLADANGTGYKELFIVEGDSAAGTLKMVRDHERQAVLPLRGKVLNTFDKELPDIIENQEIKNILLTLGCGVGQLVNLKNLRYNKIVIATDRDPDGHHISLLLMSFFLAHIRPLVEKGFVYRVVTPLYGITKGKERLFFYNDDELNAYAKKNGLPEHIDRFKGLGAHNKEEIEEFLVNEKTRRLEPLTTSDLNETLKLFNAMMGKNLELRKIIIKSGGNYE